MSLACLDTQVLTWAMQARHDQDILIQTAASGPALADWDDRKIRAAALIQELEEAKTVVSLPSVVVGELLCAVPLAKHAEALVVFARGFVVHPYDLPASQIFARLYQLRRGDGTLDALKLLPAMTRAAVKADLMIVATAIRWHADTIYSHDPGLTKIALGEIAVLQMPPRPPVQKDLFKPQPIEPKNPSST